MSVNGVGAKFFTALVNEGSLNLLNSVDRNWCVDDHEKDLFDFITTYVNRYGRLPSYSLFSESFELAEDLDDSPIYYFDELVNRTKYNYAVSLQDRLDEALRNQDIESYEEIINESLTGFHLRSTEQDSFDLTQSAGEYLEGVKSKMLNPNMRGLTFGYEKLDNDTGGLNGGDLALIIGRMKRGKTFSLLKSIIDNWLNGKAVGVVSMEMSPQQLSGRILGMIAEINPMLFRSRTVHETNYTDENGRQQTLTTSSYISSHLYNHLEDTIRGFENMPPFKFMAGNFRKSTGDIERFISMNSFDILFVDGAYLLTPQDRTKYTAKHELIGNVSADLKVMAENHNIPICATVQFNRGAVDKKDGQDLLELENIAGSDELARNATTIIALGNISGEDHKRRLKVMAVRDGAGDADIVINFRFNPRPDFSYLYNYSEGLTEQEQENLDEEEEEFLTDRVRDDV